MVILALSDCLIDYHSFWIRIGQYLEEISKDEEVILADDVNMIHKLTIGDVLIIYRHNKEWGDISLDLAQLKTRGVYIISDVDDYLWDDGWKRGWSLERLKNYTKALRNCNVITCSTSTLLQQLSVMFEGIKIQLIPNTAPRCTKVEKFKTSGILRIGWTGAPWTRPHDLDLIKPIIEKIKMHPDKYKLVHIGHLDNYPTLGTIIGMPEKMIEKHPLNGHKKYLRN